MAGSLTVEVEMESWTGGVCVCGGDTGNARQGIDKRTKPNKNFRKKALERGVVFFEVVRGAGTMCNRACLVEWIEMVLGRVLNSVGAWCFEVVVTFGVVAGAG